MATNQQNDKAARTDVNAEGSTGENRMNPLSNASNIGNTGFQSEQSGNENQNSHQGSSQPGQSGMHNQSTYNGNPTHDSAGQPYDAGQGAGSAHKSTDEDGGYTADHRNAVEKSGSFRNQHPDVDNEDDNTTDAGSEQDERAASPRTGEQNAESSQRANHPGEGTL